MFLFDDAKRNATIEAAELIGLNVLKIINEPTSAALAYYHLDKNQTEQNIAIYDLGGGTFDISIVNISNNEIKVLATDGDSNLGGFDFDNVIIDYVINEFENKTGIDLYDDPDAMQELRENAEKCKKSLSRRNKYVIPVNSEGHSVKIEITREFFNNSIKRLIDRTKMVMEDTLEAAKLTWPNIDKVLLVGGSTRVPQIFEVIKEFTGITPSKELNPDEVVALGAAVQATLIGDDEIASSNIIVKDVNSHSLGIISLNDAGEDENSIILSRNTVIPCTQSKVYYTTHDNQNKITLNITEGEDDDPEYVTIIGTTTLQLPEGLSQGSPIQIDISYDHNGIVHVVAGDLTNNCSLGEMLIERQSNITKVEMQKKREVLLEIEVE